jgi:hypothetical protein
MSGPLAMKENPPAWVCSLCGLASRQNYESAYVRHLDDLHVDELEEKTQQLSQIDFNQWRNQITKQAFILPSPT